MLHVDGNQPVLDDQEAAAWPKYRIQNVTVKGILKQTILWPWIIAQLQTLSLRPQPWS